MATPYNPLRRPVDYVLVATSDGGAYIRSPGIATIYDGDSNRKWEELATRGYTGSFTNFLNTEAAKPRIEMLLLSDKDWEDFTQFHNFMMKAPQKRGTSQDDRGYFSIYHPLLAMMGVTAVGVTSVGQPVIQESGGYLYTVKLMQWRGLPKLTLAKPKGEKPPGPESEHQKQIRDLTNQIDAALKTPKR
jgi:hypothetical protein